MFVFVRADEASSVVWRSRAICLSRQDVWIVGLCLACHEQSQLSHALRPNARLRSATGLGLALAVIMLGEELLLAALAFLFQPFDDVDGTSDVAISCIVVVVTISGD